MRTRSETMRVLGAVLILLLAACGPAQTREPRPDAAQAGQQEAVPRIDPEAGTSLSSAFRAAAHQARPAVVYVQVEHEATMTDRQGQNPFDFFFGPQGPQMPQGEMPPQVGSGSGFIIDTDGHVVTNNHVVADATHVLVRLVDGREYNGEVVGADPQSDVAVLKITPKKGETLPIVELGASEPLQVGDWVLALGSPFELEATVTAGIVSAKHRQITRRQSALESFIQTDAAINPGNSGGPLVDLGGRVVGINSAIFGGPTFVGYGFAIPIDLAKKVISDILEYGEVRRPQLGVSIRNVTAVDAEAFHLDAVRGAFVATVSDDSPAGKAGLEIGDVIVAVDGQAVEDAADLTTTLAEYQPGDDVDVAFVRGGKTQRVEVELGRFQAPETEQAQKPQGAASVETLGFRVEPLTPALAERLGFDRTDGVVVSDVTRFSPAANAGLRPGHLLLRVDGHEVGKPSDLEPIAEGIKAGDVVSLRIVTPEVGETILNYRIR